MFLGAETKSVVMKPFAADRSTDASDSAWTSPPMDLEDTSCASSMTEWHMFFFHLLYLIFFWIFILAKSNFKVNFQYVICLSVNIILHIVCESHWERFEELWSCLFKPRKKKDESCGFGCVKVLEWKERTGQSWIEWERDEVWSH